MVATTDSINITPSARRSRLRFILHVALPVIVACAIYYLGRPVESFALLRMLPEPFVRLDLPAWVRFNLPDGLWMYGFTSANIFIWHGRLTRQSAPWIAIVPVLGFGTEILQAFGAFPGTFDLFDIIAYSAATALAAWHINNFHVPITSGPSSR